MTDPTLQAYRSAREDYDTAERRFGTSPRRSIEETQWAQAYGLYKVARYNAVKAGLIPEQPQFDVEDARAQRREALRKLTQLTEEFGGYEELNNDVEDVR